MIVGGPSGVGKTTLAYALESELRGVLYPVAATECSVDKVRWLRDNLFPLAGLLGGESPWKVVLLDEAHTIQDRARDALLTVLENLNRHNLVMLTTTEPQSFDLMWQSRCIYVDMHALSDSELRELLRRHVPGASEQVVSKAVQLSKGSARQALNLAEKWMNMVE
jgi:replication-associated recombination protein RarA